MGMGRSRGVILPLDLQLHLHSKVEVTTILISQIRFPHYPKETSWIASGYPSAKKGNDKGCRFFQVLFFTAELVRAICTHRNSYGWGPLETNPAIVTRKVTGLKLLPSK